MVDQGSEEARSHMKSNDYPPDVPLGTNPSYRTDGRNDIINLENKK